MPPREEKKTDSVLLFVIELLRGERIPHVLVGALAVGLWARPRATLDVDLMISVAPEDMDKLSKAVEKRGLELDRRFQYGNPLLRHRQARFRMGDVGVDLIRAEDSLERSALQRRRRKKLGNRWVWVVSPEDLILMKLRAGRPRDFEDTIAVYWACRKVIDEGYLNRQARKLGLYDELQFVLGPKKTPT